MIQHCCREFKLGLVVEIEAVYFAETYIQRAADRALVGQQCGRINGAVIDFVVVVTGVLAQRYRIVDAMLQGVTDSKLFSAVLIDIRLAGETVGRDFAVGIGAQRTFGR